MVSRGPFVDDLGRVAACMLLAILLTLFSILSAYRIDVDVDVAVAVAVVIARLTLG